MKNLVLTCLMGLLIVTSLKAQERDFSFQEKYEMDDNPALTIRTNDGFIDVYPNNSNTIEVYYIVKQRGRLVDISRAELEKELNLDVTYDKNNLEISIRQFKTAGWVNWRNKYTVSFEIKVPKKIACYLKSSDGDVYLRGLSGDQMCKTSDGDIDVTFVKGDVKAATSDGDIFVKEIVGYTELKTSDGSIKAQKVLGDLDMVTSDGSVDAFNVKGNIYVHTSDGNITFDGLKGSLKAQTSDGHIDGSISELYDLLDLKTTDGDIDVVIPEGLGLDLTLRGERIYTDLGNYRRSSKDRNIKDVVNGGGIEVSLRTTDGKISLSSK